MKEILFKKDEAEWLKNLLMQSAQPMAEKIIKKLERAEKKITTSSAKGKGRNLQYWVCEKIAEKFGVKFDQRDDESLVQSRPMGQHDVDIILRGEVKKKFPFDIECKCCESLSLPQWIRQARENEKENQYWMLVFKKQTLGTKPIVCLDFETFLKFYKKD